MPQTTHSNNFDALRLLAALLVVVGHGEMLTGQPISVLWGIQASHVGLDIFFAISGYLVTDSFERTPAASSFFAKRALRIVPGLAVCVLASTFVLGPVLTKLPLGTYLASHITWKYLENLVLWVQLYLPGVFVGAPLGGAVNGSLWSLTPEVMCYLTVPVLALLGWPLRAACLVAVGGGFGALSLWLFSHQLNVGHYVWNADAKYMLAEAPFFFAGSLLRVLQPRLPDLFRGDLAIIALVSNYAISSVWGASNVPFEWLTLTYTVIAFGRMQTPVLRDAARFGDLSYGFYIYAFPVQQWIIRHWLGHAPILRCIGLSLVLALLSWHLVERPALRLKPRAAADPRITPQALPVAAGGPRAAAR